MIKLRKKSSKSSRLELKLLFKVQWARLLYKIDKWLGESGKRRLPEERNYSIFKDNDFS